MTKFEFFFRLYQGLNVMGLLVGSKISSAKKVCVKHSLKLANLRLTYLNDLRLFC